MMGDAHHHHGNLRVTNKHLPPGDDPGIDRKVEFLKRPAAYDEPVGQLRAVETHMSWVFLTDEHAYKLKKPVRYPYLDFSTLEARRRDCEEELRLNLRMAPDVYLGSVRLTRPRAGELALGGAGPVVDWLVKMRRLPEEGMLDRLIRKHAVPPGKLHELAALLARFYRAAPPVTWPPGELVHRLRRDTAENARELLRPRYGLAGDTVRTVHAAQTAFLARAAALLERRVAEGRVVEGHGDLRPEHVSLADGPAIIDCLEFDRELRLLDAFDELAYLALECERLGEPGVGGTILETYAQLSGDHPDPRLIDFYKSHRACLRAKLAVWHIDDAAEGDRAKWLAAGETYLGLAEKYAGRLD